MAQITGKVAKYEELPQNSGISLYMEGKDQPYYVPVDKLFIKDKYPAGSSVKVLVVTDTVKAVFPLNNEAPPAAPPKQPAKPPAGTSTSQAAANAMDTQKKMQAAGFKPATEVKEPTEDEIAAECKEDPATCKQFGEMTHRCARAWKHGSAYRAICPHAPPIANPQQTPKSTPSAAPATKTVQKPATTPEPAKTGDKASVANLIHNLSLLSQDSFDSMFDKEPEIMSKLMDKISKYYSGQTAIPARDDEDELPTDKALRGMIYSSDTYWRAKALIDERTHNEIRAQVEFKNWSQSVHLAIEFYGDYDASLNDAIFPAAEDIHAFIERHVYGNSDDPDQ